MTQFDQRDQRIMGQQYNAGRDINQYDPRNDISVRNVQTPEEFVDALEQLKAEIGQAQHSGALSEDEATDAQYQLTKASLEAKKPAPEKKNILEHLQSVKKAAEGVATMTNFVTAISALIQAVGTVF